MSDSGVTEISLPLSEAEARALRAGQRLLLSGTCYSCRDLAHGRIAEALARGSEPPFDPRGQAVYYAGPTPARPGMPVGSIGPTTSYRMDPYVEPLLRAGLRAMIGKGPRSAAVRAMLGEYGAVYLVATGGAGALLASRVRVAEVIAYPELGPEAVRRLELEGFPVWVACDTEGGDIYEEGQAQWRSRT
jgi:fumarate hydratase subunit beta